MTTAYAYHRFSTPRQERGSSIERQREATLARAKREGWEIAEIVTDLGRSAWKGDHLRTGNLGRWRNRVDTGDIEPGSVLLVENLDRLSRQDTRTARRWIEDLTDRGVAVAVCSPELYLDAAAMSGSNIGAMIMHLMESVRSHAESERKAGFRVVPTERQRAKAREGKAVTKRLPAYLRIADDERIEGIPERTATVVMIYQWSASGMGYDAIAKRLNATIEPWGKVWNVGYVKDLLMSPIVEGEYHPRSGVDRKPTGEIIRGYYPRIVEAALVDAARSAIKTRGKTGGRTYAEAKNLFTGLIRCACCGGAMTRTLNRSKGVEYEYLLCRATRAGTCDNTARYNYRTFEKTALDLILHLALDSSFFVHSDDVAPRVAKLAEAKKAVERFEHETATTLALLKRVPTSEALIDDLKASELALGKSRKRLADAEAALDEARGKVSPEAHLKRIVAVGEAIYSPDPNARVEARRLVRDAIQSVIAFIDFDRTWRDNLRFDRKISIATKGNHLGWIIDNEGNILETVDTTAYPNSSDPFLRRLGERMLIEGAEDTGAVKNTFAYIVRRHRQNAMS